jgi:hypothetical protein
MIQEVNEIVVVGELRDIAYKYTFKGQEYYTGTVKVKAPNGRGNKVYIQIKHDMLVRFLIEQEVPLDNCERLSELEGLVDMVFNVKVSGGLRSKSFTEEDRLVKVTYVRVRGIQVMEKDWEYYNQASIAGLIVKAHSPRVTAKGKSVQDLIVEISRHHKKARASFISVVTMGGEEVKLGDFISVKGPLVTRSWVHKESGGDREATEVIASQLIRG